MSRALSSHATLSGGQVVNSTFISDTRLSLVISMLLRRAARRAFRQIEAGAREAHRLRLFVVVGVLAEDRDVGADEVHAAAARRRCRPAIESRFRAVILPSGNVISTWPENSASSAALTSKLLALISIGCAPRRRLRRRSRVAAANPERRIVGTRQRSWANVCRAKPRTSQNAMIDRRLAAGTS